jgi:hypothetical protein
MLCRAHALFAVLAALAVWCAAAAAAEPAGHPPLSLHPDNPRYFLFRGKPAVLITSGEHYGAILNRDFDYIPYLDELKSRGFNLTRAFAGTYREHPGAFNIPDNTLAPATESFVCPWPRSRTPGAGDGGNRFDLTTFDPAYLARLKDFIAQAGKRGIVVELVFFCTMYDQKLWAASPMNAANNTSGVGAVGPYEVYSNKDRRLTEVQQALVRRLVAELRDFDNVYYEICNEPYERDGVAKEWNDAIIAAIVETEMVLLQKHLIAQGFPRREVIRKPNGHVSVFNFHAASPHDALANLALRRPLADDETGGKGNAPAPYRLEAWQFLLSGGAVFSHLDFSFTARHPDGKARFDHAPGGGGPEFRRQLQVLKKFLDGFDLIRMRPEPSVIKRAPPGVSAAALLDHGKAYAIHITGGKQADIVISLPRGPYLAEWINPVTGNVEHAERFTHEAGDRAFRSPGYELDVALRIVRADE